MERWTGSREAASAGRTTLERWGRSRIVAEVELVVLCFLISLESEASWLQQSFSPRDGKRK